MFGFRTRLPFLCAGFAWLVLAWTSASGFGQEAAPATETPAPAADAPAAASETPAPATPAPAAETPAPATPAPAPAAASPSNEPAAEPALTPEPPAPEEPRADRGRRRESETRHSPPAVTVRAYNPDTSFTRLAHPDIAKRIGLSDEQRAQVSAILAERAGALQGAAGDPKADIQVKVDYERKLSEVLTPQQLTEWPDKVVQRTLRFNFRFQLWTDVLEWFAGEAGLSLVMNNPPPGTFNYSDSKQYTPEEAIDVLNRVLLTHGFTLIRSDKMLIVQDLSPGIPDGLIPVVDAKALDQRGDFELVTVRTPLGKREADKVIAEITPVKGVYGQIVPLPTTAQLLITDTARNVKTMLALIEAIPEPKAPEKPAPPPEKPAPPPPELVVYPITKADPRAAQEILIKMIPTATMQFDEKRAQLYVYTTPNFHTTVAKVLENMEADLPPERQRTLEIYSIKEAAQPVPISAPTPAASPGAGDEEGRRRRSRHYEEGDGSVVYDSYGRPRYRIDAYGRRIPISQDDRSEWDRSSSSPSETATAPTSAVPASESFVGTLQAMVPGAELHLDRKNARLMAFATAAEHQIIKSIIEKLSGNATADEMPLVEVYPIAHSDPDSLKTMFESLFPGVQVNIDEATSSMVVFAYPSEQASIKETLNRLMPPPVDGQPARVPSANELRFYPLKRRAPDNLVDGLKKLAPKAEISIDSELKRLTVVANSADQQAIQAAVDKIQAGGGEDGESYFEIYSVPNMPASNDRMAGRGFSSSRYYAARSFADQIEPFAPYAEITVDYEKGNLLVLGTAKEHAAVKAAIERIQAGGQNTPQMQIYTLKSEVPRTLREGLEQLVPRAMITIDENAQQISVVAVPEDQSVVKDALAKIEEAGVSKAELRFHPVQDDLPPTVLTLLAELAPKAKITPDPENDRLMVLASAEDQAKISETITKVEEAGSTKPELRFYPIKDELPAAVLSILTTLAPKAQITPDPSHKYLSVVATPADHELIAKTIEQATNTLPAEEKEKLVVYPVTTQQRTRFETVLSSVQAQLPGVKVIPDSAPGRLSIWARPSEHEVLAEIMQELSQDVAPEEEFQLVAYAIKSANPSSVTQVLGELFPDTRVTLDASSNRLLIWTRPEEHEAIRRALDQIDAEAPPAEQRRFEVYAIGGVAGLSPAGRAAKASAFLENLQSLVPNAKLTIDSETGNLVVFATPAEHEIIRTAVEKLGQFTSAAYTPQLEVHELTTADPTTTVSILQGLVPRAEITVDTANNRLIVLAPPDSQMTIRNTLAQLQSTDPGINDPQVRVIDLKQKASQSLTDVLIQLAPKANVTVDKEGKRLVVVATAADHEIVARTVQQIDGALAGEEENALMVYPVTPGQRKRFEAVVEKLAEELPGVDVIDDQEPTQLSVWAKPSEHRVIGEILMQLKAGAATEAQKRFEAYSIQGAVGYETSPGGHFTTAATLMTGIQELVPGVKMMIDTKNDKLIAWATPEEHEMLKAAVEKLAPTSGEAAPQLQVYMLKRRAPDNLVDGLRKLAPKAEISIDSESKRLTVVANSADQEAVKAAVDKIQTGGGEDGEPYFELYPISGMPASSDQMFGRGYSSSRYYAARSFADQIEPFAPYAEITVDYEKGNLLVLGTPKEHAAIKAAIEKIQAGGKNTPELQIYTFENDITESLVEGLTQLVPRAKFNVDEDARQISVVATAEEHAALKTAVEKLNLSGLDNSPDLQVYMLKRRAPDNLVDGLKKLAPKAEISIDSEYKRLTVVAKAADQQAIKSAVDKIQAGGGEDGEPYFEIYTISGMPAANDQMAGRGYSSSRYYAARSFADQIEPFAPYAEITVDYQKGNLLVLGTAKEHAAIKSAIAQIQAGGKNTPQLQIYTLKNQIPETLREGLEQLVPSARITIDERAQQISVVATPEDQTTVKETLDRIEAAAGEKEKPYFKVYAITAIETDAQYSSSRYYAARAMADQLEELVPKAKVSIDYRRGNLLVFGTQEEHAAVESALAGLSDGGSEDNPETLVVYRLSNADERAVYYLLRNLVPKAKLSMDFRADSIMAFATAADHAVIKATIDQLDFGADNPNAPQLRFYAMQESPPRKLIDGLEQLAPKAQITYDPDSRKLMVIATAGEHAVIEKNLAKIQETAAAETKTQLKVYEIGSADMATVQTVLEELYPDIRIQMDEKNDRMIVTAMPDQHEGIAAAIETMDGDTAGDSQKKTVAYSISEVDANTAIRILESLVTDMKLYPDATGSKIVAYGRERDHKIVVEAIEQMEAGPEDAYKPYLMIYPTGDAAPATLTQILANLAPKANVVVDTESESLAVFAVEKDQETVRAAIESMAITATGSGKPMAMTYTLKEIPVASATQILSLAVPKAQTATGRNPQQLIVWANARDQATVKATLEVVDVETPEGSKQTAAVYALEGINPNYSYYSLRIIREAVPSASMTLGADPTQVVVWATAKDHETIKQLVKSIVEQPPELKPVMEVYTLEKVDALVAIRALQRVVRDAELSVGNNAGQLVAWARPKDQETIKEALAKLTEADASPTAPTMEIYKLESGDAPSAMRTLADVVPEAKFSVGKDADQLIAWARPADHVKIKEAVAKIDAAGPKPTMKIYTLERLEALSVVRMLRSIVPEAAAEIGADSSQLVVWATEEDHAEVDNAIKQLSTQAPEGKAPMAVTYQLNSLTAKTAEQILKEAAPAAKFTEGEDEYQLIIWARPDEHTEIEKTLQRIDLEGTGGGSEKAVIYELDAGSTSQMYYVGRFLQQVVPKASFTPGVNPDQLVAWARPKDHEQIRELIEQLADKENGPKAVVYDSGNVAAATVTSSLRQIVPRAVVTSGATPSQLVVWASPLDHDKVKEVIDQLTSADSPDLMPTAVTYSLEHINTTTAGQLLRLAVPQAQISPGAETHQLIAWAVPKDQDLIQKTLEKIDVEGPEDKSAQLAVYQLKTTNAVQLYYIGLFLRGAVPGASFTAGVVPGQVIAWARPKDHKKIAELIEKVEGGEGLGPVAQVYDLGDTTATAVMGVVRQVVPTAITSTGKTPYELVVWARSSEQEMVKEIVDQMTAEAPPETAPKMVTYALDGPSPASVTALIRQVVPQAITAAGADPYQLVVWARPADHEKIAELIDELSAEGTPGTMPSMEIYTLENIDSLSVRTLLRTVAPEAQVSVGKDPQQLVVWARPHDHKLIAAALERLSQEEPAESAPRMEIYKLESGDVLSAIRVLTPIVPEASLSAGSASDQMVVWARPKDHAKIKETIATLDASGAKPEMRIYPLKGIDALNATRLLRSVAPEALCNVGTDQYELIVWARPNDHEKVKQSLDELAAEDAPEKLPTAVIYSLEEISTSSAMQILRMAVPQAQVNPGTETYQLLVWARPDDHKKVEETLAQIDVKGPEDKEAKAVAYKLDGMNVTQGYYALRFLAQSIPTARFTQGVTPDQIIAWAQPKVHEDIAELIDQIQGGEGNAPKPVVYQLKNVTSSSVSVMLRQVVPEAISTQGTDPYQMVIWARPDDHEKIKQIVEELSAADLPERAPRAVTYTLEEISAQTAMAMLRLAVPQAQLSAGAEPYQLIVWARPDDQVLVEQTLKQIDVKGPDEKLATAKVYELGIGDIRQMVYVLRFLQTSIPEAQFTLGSSAKQIIAWARPKDHEEIQKLVDEFAETPETAPRITTYNLDNTSAAAAIQLLSATFPMARFNVGSDPRQLLVWARGEDHAKIAEAVIELSKKESEETAPRLVVYPLQSANATQVISILRSITPSAQYGVGANARQLSVWARPADHEIIKKTIEELAKEEPEETRPQVRVYTVETVDAPKAMSVLTTAVPEATVSPGNDARQLVVFARPAEHERVKATLDQLASKGPDELQPTIVIYTLPTEGAAHAMQVLTPVVPQAKFTVGADPSKLIVWAYPEDHQIIASAVQQIEADSWLDGNRIMSVYPMKLKDVSTFMKLLEPTILQHAQFVPDAERECIIVWADKRYDEAIKRTIDEFHKVVPEIIEPTAVVYRFEKTDITTAYRILQTLVPEARIAYDYRSGALVATAMPEDHEKIRQTIEEMNRDALEMAPRLQVHQITSADPARVLSILTDLFRGEYNVQLSLDRANDSLIAYAAPLQQDKIAELIAEIEKGSKLDTANQLKLYELKNVDGYAAESVLADMFQRQGVRVDLTVDRYRNQLIAMARPEQHEKIAEVLEQFRIEDRELEIFQLEYVDLSTANLAIRRLFADESYLSQPEVDPDPATGQLFVKASAAQLEEIRKLLIRMGETNLIPAQQSSGGNLRVIPFRGNTKNVLEEVQKAFSALRSNPVRVVTPGELTLPPPETSAPKKEAKPPAVKKEPTKPAGTSDAKSKTSKVQRGAWTAPIALVSMSSAGAAVPAEEDAAAPADAQAAAVEASPVQPTTDAAAESAAEPEPPAEVLIIAGEGSFTIASQDKEALDELESLLRTISARMGFASRDYSVFQIQNTPASEIAQTLQQLFRSRDPQTAAAGSSRYGYGRYGYGYGYGTQMTAPLIVADDRLNTILVKGTRADRQTIEGLLEILDTAEMAESVATAYEPKMIPLKHTEAARVLQMIQTVFRSHFTTASASSNFAPQVTVDEVTNSLIVKAPPRVLDEITKFAESLDTAADEGAASRLYVIQLKRANSLRVQQMLDAMLRGSTGTRATPYRAPYATPYRPR